MLPQWTAFSAMLLLEVRSAIIETLPGMSVQSEKVVWGISIRERKLLFEKPRTMTRCRKGSGMGILQHSALRGFLKTLGDSG